MSDSVALLTAIRARLAGDGALSALVEAVDIERQPDQPEKVTKPRVVIGWAGAPDEIGLHGAATNPGIEVNIWGFGLTMLKAVRQAADRIDVLLLAPFDITEGETMKFRGELGWQPAEQPNPDTIRRYEIYRTRWMPASRVQRLVDLG